MASEVIESKDAAKTLKFLYKFQKGVATQSFGIFIAQLAGVNDSIIKRARQKAIEFGESIP